jgi:hypothetical protein
MASRSPPSSKQGRREDDADEEPLFDDTKFGVEVLRSTFRKLEGVGEACDIKCNIPDFFGMLLFAKMRISKKIVFDVFSQNHKTVFLCTHLTLIE